MDNRGMGEAGVWGLRGLVLHLPHSLLGQQIQRHVNDHVFLVAGGKWVTY